MPPNKDNANGGHNNNNNNKPPTVSASFHLYNSASRVQLVAVVMLRFDPIYPDIFHDPNDPSAGRDLAQGSDHISRSPTYRRAKKQ